MAKSKSKAKPKNKKSKKSSKKYERSKSKPKPKISVNIDINKNVRRSKRTNPSKIVEEAMENRNEEAIEVVDRIKSKEEEEFNNEMEVKEEIIIDDDEVILEKENSGEESLSLKSTSHDCGSSLNSAKIRVQDMKNESLVDSENMEINENDEEILAREIMQMKCFPDLQELIYKESIKSLGHVSPIQQGDSSIQEINNNEEIKTLENEEIINCTCGYKEEDGLMIQCDVCLTWQHALCTGIQTQAQIPENYNCIYCLESTNVRCSQKFAYAKYLLTVSKLPTFSKRTIDSKAQTERRRPLTDSFKLRTELRKIENMDRTLRTKLSIAKESDHPKLYMWSANWDTTDDEKQEPGDGPVGEKPIESLDCRLRLLDKIENDQREVSYRLTLIHDMIDRLESDLYVRSVEERSVPGVLHQIAKDLKTISTAVAIS